MTYQFSGGKKGFNISKRSLESLCVDSKKEQSLSFPDKHHEETQILRRIFIPVSFKQFYVC